MALQGQRIQPGRYTILPRTLTFLLRGEQILLMKLGENRAGWSGKYNGIGGHIEQGEDPLSSARREVWEETGLRAANLSLAGVVMVDTGEKPGVGLFVFIGSASSGSISPGSEGQPEWIPIDEVRSMPLVSDLVELLPAAIRSHEQKEPFSAITTFDKHGNPHVQFSKI